MKPISVEQVADRLRGKSLILAYDPEHPYAGVGQRPRSSGALDLSEEGCKKELAQITDETTDKNGFVRGDLPAARLKVKEALHAWEVWRDAQPNLNSKTKPYAQWADTLNRRRAVVLVLEEECRKLHALIKHYQAQRLEERPVRRRAPKLGGKLRDGRFVEFAGRPVYQDDEGADRFRDDDTLVNDYIEATKAKEKARTLRKIKARKAREEAANG